MSKLAVTVHPNPNHVCPQSDGPKPHSSVLILPNNSQVFFEKKQVCLDGNPLQCMASPSPNKAVASNTVVYVQGKKVIRAGDNTQHGGKILPNTSTIFIG